MQSKKPYSPVQGAGRLWATPETSESPRYAESRALFERAARVIPSGIPGHMGPVQSQFIPIDAYPFFADRARGSYFWDVDGNRFIDYMCAFGPNVLGYNNPVVEEAADQQRRSGDTMALPSRRQVELAELLCETITGAQWALFMKNGNDATTLALMVARAATGRKKAVLVRKGYHGVAPWTQHSGRPGVLEEDVANNLYVEWNDFEQLEQAVRDHPGEIAVFMASPYHHPIFEDNSLPAPDYWQKVRELCDRHGIVLAVDDIRAGFRISMAGSADYFGFVPDLSCYCKALGNGYNIAALVGSEQLRDAASSVFYTGSYWYGAVPMAAAIATIKELSRIDGPRLMNENGRRLTGGLVEAARDHGIHLVVSGMPSMFYLRVANDNSLMMTQEFTAEAARRGAFFVSHHNHFVNTSLSDEDIDTTVSIAHEAFGAVARNNPDRIGSGFPG